MKGGELNTNGSIALCITPTVQRILVASHHVIDHVMINDTHAKWYIETIQHISVIYEKDTDQLMEGNKLEHTN